MEMVLLFSVKKKYEAFSFCDFFDQNIPIELIVLSDSDRNGCLEVFIVPELSDIKVASELYMESSTGFCIEALMINS